MSTLKTCPLLLAGSYGVINPDSTDISVNGIKYRVSRKGHQVQSNIISFLYKTMTGEKSFGMVKHHLGIMEMEAKLKSLRSNAGRVSFIKFQMTAESSGIPSSWANSDCHLPYCSWCPIISASLSRMALHYAVIMCILFQKINVHKHALKKQTLASSVRKALALSIYLSDRPMQT